MYDLEYPPDWLYAAYRSLDVQRLQCLKLAVVGSQFGPRLFVGDAARKPRDFRQVDPDKSTIQDRV